MAFPDPGTLAPGEIWVNPDSGYGYVWSETNERWEVVNGPHSGHVWVSTTPPQLEEGRKPVCEGEFWYDETSRTLKIYIEGKWVAAGYSDEFLGVWQYAACYVAHCQPMAAVDGKPITPVVRHGEIVFNQDELRLGWRLVSNIWLDGSAIPLGINDQSKNEQGVLVPVWTGVIRRGMQLTLRVRQSDQQNNSTDANMGVYRVLTDLNPATGHVRVECIKWLGDAPYTPGFSCDVLVEHAYNMNDMHNLCMKLDAKTYRNDVHVGDTPPNCPEVGQLWYCTNDDEEIGITGDTLKICVRAHHGLDDIVWVDASTSILEEDAFVKKSGDKMCGPLHILTDGNTPYENDPALESELFRIDAHLYDYNINDPRQAEPVLTLERDYKGAFIGALYHPPQTNKRCTLGGRGKVMGTEIITRRYMNDQFQRGWPYLMCRIHGQSNNEVDSWIEDVVGVINPGECYQHQYKQEYFIFHPYPMADFDDDPRTVASPLDVHLYLQDTEDDVNFGDNMQSGKARDGLAEVDEPGQNQKAFSHKWIVNPQLTGIKDGTDKDYFVSPNSGTIRIFSEHNGLVKVWCHYERLQPLIEDTSQLSKDGKVLWLLKIQKLSSWPVNVHPNNGGTKIETNGAGSYLLAHDHSGFVCGYKDEDGKEYPGHVYRWNIPSFMD